MNRDVPKMKRRFLPFDRDAGSHVPQLAAAAALHMFQRASSFHVCTYQNAVFIYLIGKTNNSYVSAHRRNLGGGGKGEKFPTPPPFPQYFFYLRIVFVSVILTNTRTHLSLASQ